MTKLLRVMSKITGKTQPFLADLLIMRLKFLFLKITSF